MSDFTNVQIFTLETNELVATADSANLGGIIPTVFIFTSPATISHSLREKMFYNFSALYHGTDPQTNKVQFQSQGDNNTLSFLLF